MPNTTSSPVLWRVCSSERDVYGPVAWKFILPNWEHLTDQLSAKIYSVPDFANGRMGVHFSQKLLTVVFILGSWIKQVGSHTGIF